MFSAAPIPPRVLLSLCSSACAHVLALALLPPLAPPPPHEDTPAFVVELLPQDSEPPDSSRKRSSGSPESGGGEGDGDGGRPEVEHQRQDVAEAVGLDEERCAVRQEPESSVARADREPAALTVIDAQERHEPPRAPKEEQPPAESEAVAALEEEETASTQPSDAPRREVGSDREPPRPNESSSPETPQEDAATAEPETTVADSPAAEAATTAAAEPVEAGPAAAREQAELQRKGAGDSLQEPEERQVDKRRPDRSKLRQARDEEKPERKRAAKQDREEPELEQLEWTPFVWTDAGLGDPLQDTDAIAAHDVHADERARPEVTQDAEGPTLDGVESKVLGTPSPVRASPDEVPRPASGTPEVTRDPTEDERTAAEASAAPTATEAVSATQEATQPNRSASPAVAANGAIPTPFGATPAQPVAPVPSGVTTPVELEEVAEVEVPDWWRPVSELLTGGSPSASQPATELGQPDPAVEGARTSARPEHVARDGEEGGERRPTQPVAQPSSAGGERVQRAREAQRDVDEPAIASGHPLPARPTEPFAPARSPLASFDEAKDVEVAKISASATPLGMYIHEIDLLIRQRWGTGDLGVTDRAFGLGGDVVVQFLVSGHGKVVNVQIVQGSGVAALDALARLAIPEKLPPPPEGPLAHRITFKYRSR